jgi:hypothetical protein
MTLTELQARVSKTAAFTGAGVNVSGITGDWTIKLQVESLTAAKKARFVFEDTVDDYTASLAGPAFSLSGQLSASSDKVKSFKKADFPSLRLGAGSAQLRLKLSEIDGSATCVYRAWLEY